MNYKYVWEKAHCALFKGREIWCGKTYTKL